MARPVDEAMAADRPEKNTVRQLWMEEIARVDGTPDPGDVPLYLTTPGALGKDISLLVEHGILELEENEAVKEPEKLRFVAIENSLIARIELRKQFPGIKVLEADLRSILKAENMMNFPDKSQRPLFRARVVNLDLESPLEAEVADGQLQFPLLTLVHKIAVLHTEPPVDWTLCLTMHGEAIWRGHSAKRACDFLTANFERDATFASQAKATLGQDIFGAICTGKGKALKELGRSDQRLVLMVLVPKRIAFDAHRHGWSVDTIENLHYGEADDQAGMVTWMLRFKWDERATTEADSIYREALPRILARHGHITPRGLLRRAA
jgi:hypothetical protein